MLTATGEMKKKKVTLPTLLVESDCGIYGAAKVLTPSREGILRKSLTEIVAHNTGKSSRSLFRTVAGVQV